jgi:hypothetical protein
VVLSAGEAAYYLWSDSTTQASITVYTTGVYSVTVTSPNGCSAVAEPVSVSVHPLPDIPVITASDSVLMSSSGSGNQWFYYDSLIAGATGQFYMAMEEGLYTVMVTDSNGCSSISDPYDFSTVGISPLAGNAPFIIIPNPGSGLFHILLREDQPLGIVVFNAVGQVIFDRIVADGMLDLSDAPSGVYVVLVRIDGRSFARKLIVQE